MAILNNLLLGAYPPCPSPPELACPEVPLSATLYGDLPCQFPCGLPAIHFVSLPLDVHGALGVADPVPLPPACQELYDSALDPMHSWFFGKVIPYVKLKIHILCSMFNEFVTKILRLFLFQDLLCWGHATKKFTLYIILEFDRTSCFIFPRLNSDPPCEHSTWRASLGRRLIIPAARRKAHSPEVWPLATKGQKNK